MEESLRFSEKWDGNCQTSLTGNVYSVC